MRFSSALNIFIMTVCVAVMQRARKAAAHMLRKEVDSDAGASPQRTSDEIADDIGNSMLWRRSLSTVQRTSDEIADDIGNSMLWRRSLSTVHTPSMINP